MTLFLIYLIKEKRFQISNCSRPFSGEEINYCRLPLYNSEYKGNSKSSTAVGGHLYICTTSRVTATHYMDNTVYQLCLHLVLQRLAKVPCWPGGWNQRAVWINRGETVLRSLEDMLLNWRTTWLIHCHEEYTILRIIHPGHLLKGITCFCVFECYSIYLVHARRKSFLHLPWIRPQQI